MPITINIIVADDTVSSLLSEVVDDVVLSSETKSKLDPVSVSIDIDIDNMGGSGEKCFDQRLSKWLEVSNDKEFKLEPHHFIPSILSFVIMH